MCSDQKETPLSCRETLSLFGAMSISSSRVLRNEKVLEQLNEMRKSSDPKIFLWVRLKSVVLIYEQSGNSLCSVLSSNQNVVLPAFEEPDFCQSSTMQKCNVCELPFLRTLLFLRIL